MKKVNYRFLLEVLRLWFQSFCMLIGIATLVKYFLFQETLASRDMIGEIITSGVLAVLFVIIFPSHLNHDSQDEHVSNASIKE